MSLLRKAKARHCEESRYGGMTWQSHGIASLARNDISVALQTITRFD